MAVKPQYETYRYTGEVAKLHSQSMVECRLSGSEIGGILAMRATAVTTDCTCVDGEVRYKGKAVLCIVYEDVDGKVCRAERGVEFFHKAECKDVTPACFAKTVLDVVNITHRREGSGLYITLVVDADTDVYGSKQIEYLIGGEDVVCKTQNVTLCKTVCVSGETEGEDEFETEYASDILLHGENVVVTKAEASGGQLEIEGEIVLGVCALNSSGGVCSYERIVPFAMQIPCEEAFGEVNVSSRVCVKSATLTAGLDEDKGISKMLFSYTLCANCYLSRLEELTVAQDAFCVEYETQLQKACDTGRYLTKTSKHTQRVEGSAVFIGENNAEFILEAGMLPRVETACRHVENGVQVEGVITADVIVKNAENNRKNAVLSLPFSFVVDTDGEEVEADAVVCGFSAKRKAGGETEAEATLKLCLRSYNKQAWEYVKEYTVGEQKPKCDAAVSVFMTRAGENLWQVAKRLSATPEALQSANPELTFPVEAGRRIFVYRQIK